MSLLIDADFPKAERQKLLAEVKTHLPAFLHHQTSEQHDPVGDVKELLNLTAEDLEEVKAVHLCLDEAVLAFGESLVRGLRNPITSSARPPEVSQTVRGPVDWGATIRRRSLEAGNPTLFVVRSAERIFDTPENQALAWLIERLSAAVQRAGAEASATEPREEARGWFVRIAALGVQLQRARRVGWLRRVKPAMPTPIVLKQLEAARRAFYARDLLQAIRSVLAIRDPGDDQLTEILCRRYFRPERTWLLFELAVALRLARAFAAKSPKPRRTRLLVGSGRATFARYEIPDGGEVALIYQAWPKDPAPSLRRGTAQRHGFDPKSSRPDLFIVRTGPQPDCAILELKATYAGGYLGSGLSQLLGYLAERPKLWKRRPAGWLVAPSSVTFSDQPADSQEELWVVSAEAVAECAVERFTKPWDPETAH